MTCAPPYRPSTDSDIEPRVAQLVASLMNAKTGANDICARLLDEVGRQAVRSSAGGKRLRAALAMAAFDATHPTASSGTTPTAHDLSHGRTPQRTAMLDVACAVEVFQTAALIHDDIIDGSNLRRGKPSAHRALSELTGKDSLGEGLAMMAGDILATGSIDIVRRAAHDLTGGDAVLAAFTSMQREVGIGQVLDLAMELMPLDDAAALGKASLNVFRWKTASYTTIAPLELGLCAGGMDPPQARTMAVSIGEPLGIAFQLADDVLDVDGHSERTGKPVGGDVREGKRSVLLADTLEAAQPRERDLLVSLYAAPHRQNSDVERIITAMRHTGALRRSRERIEALCQRALTAIANSDFDEAGKALLRTACRRFLPGFLPDGE